MQISYKTWTNEFVIESLKLVSDIVIARFANDILDASHHMVDESFVDAFVHRRFLLFGSLHIQNFHQRFDGDALDENREVNDGDGRCHEHWL